MKDDQLIYIELKSGSGDTGSAWISRVKWSKTRRTLYFNGRALKRGQGIGANFYCLETGDEYWVSGAKKNGQDRHWAGGGSVMIDSRIAEEYRKFLNVSELDPGIHPVVTDIQDTDPAKFVDIENQSHS